MTSQTVAGRMASELPEVDVRTPAEATYDVGGTRPAAVVTPSAPEQVAAVLGMADREGWTVAPVGGGTMLLLGNPPQRLDIALELRGLNRVVDYQPDDLTLTVQAGITLADVHRLLEARGQMLPLDVPLPEQATVGGALAANAFGPRRLRYGTARDLVIGMQFALADGTLARSGGKVVKNVAGYDLGKLMIGALGTLGVITEATFKLWPAPQTTAAVVAVCSTLEQALSVARSEALGILFPAWTVLLGPGVAVESAAPSHGWRLAAGFYGSSRAVERQLREVRQVFDRSGSKQTAALDAAAEARLLAQVRDHGYAPRSSASFVLRASSSRAEASIAALSRAGDTLGAEPRLIVLPEFGIATAFWQTDAAAPVEAALAVARNVVIDQRGSVVVERAPAGGVADAWGVEGPDVALMRRLKQVYDPHATLNPGRFVGGI